MKMRFAAQSAGLLLVSVVWARAQTAETIDFNRQVHPIFAAKCLSCHSEEKRSGALSLATYGGVLAGGRNGGAIRPGNSAESLLMRRVDGQAQPAMPLGADPLTSAEIALIAKWIDQGARATPTSKPGKAKWEAPLVLAAPAIPPATWTDWTEPLDRFVSAYLARRGGAKPRPAPDRVFARRVYLDVTGLLPSPEDLQTFVNDRALGKRRKLVERLLAENQQYAENWITFWNDLLRNDEGVGYAGSRKSITDWLLPALKANLPYDQFVNNLLNPMTPSDPDGFLTGVNWRGDINASQTPHMQAAQNAAQIFLGINLKCNSCHDSFIAKWKLKDAYSLAGYFSPDSKLELFRCDTATGQFAEPGFLFSELNHVPPSGSLADRRATVASIFTDPRNGRLPRTMVNRIWQRLFGRGIVDPPDEMDGEPWSPETLDWLASDFVEHRYDLKRLLATILTSRAYEMPSIPRAAEQSREYVFRGPEIRRMSAEQFADAIGSITGEWRVLQPQGTNIGAYSREWRLASTSLTRALGRPIRDQVVSVRDNEAATLQALELVNGQKLTHWLMRGATKMLGQLPPEPASVFDSGSIRMQPKPSVEPNPVAFDIDVSKAAKVWLIVQDVDSYEPEKVEAVWGHAEFVNSDGSLTKLSSLKPLQGAGLRTSDGPIDYKGSHGEGVRVMTPSLVAYDISGKGFARLRGVVSIETRSLRDDINPRIRFFVFDKEPNMERLVSVASELPVPFPGPLLTSSQIVDRVFQYALGRAPAPGERRAAGNALKVLSPASVADLLWAVLMKPEFQLIR